MSSKREEERNEKIIRGLMKLPPNRRCINCNSLGPQYVCTNFWTFVCMICSGIHREFTHRVKSVSMAKFTSQEVDALQNGGNQRARELFLKSWDPQSQRLPDNSNVDKVREFIKNVYVQKNYAMEKSSNMPPKDPQSLRSREDETKRASSYHSYSQSPPYDFQYEERRYGKQAPSLTRKPGSDRGLYVGKLSSFLSPNRFSDHSTDDRFMNESSKPRMSDYSISNRGDQSRSDITSPSFQSDVEIPVVETSREIPPQHVVLHEPDTNSRNPGGLHRQISSSPEILGSLDSSFMSAKSTATGLEKVSLLAKQSDEIPNRTASSSVHGNFSAVDLFSSPSLLTPQNAVFPTSSVTNSQMQELSSVQFTDLFQQIPTVVPILNEQEPFQTSEKLVKDTSSIPPQRQESGVYTLNEKTSDVVKANNGGWATFDIPQGIVPVGTSGSVLAALAPSDGFHVAKLNSSSLEQSSSTQDYVNHEPSVSGPTFSQKDPKHIEASRNNTDLWNVFNDFARDTSVHNILNSSDHGAELQIPEINKSAAGFSLYEVPNNDGNYSAFDSRESPSMLSSHFNMTMNDLSLNSALGGVHPFAINHKPTNPFDLPYDPEVESGNVFWEMSSLQAVLPNNQMPTALFGGANQSPWYPHNSDALAFLAAQTSTNKIPNVTSQDQATSIGGNPFA